MKRDPARFPFMPILHMHEAKCEETSRKQTQEAKTKKGFGWIADASDACICYTYVKLQVAKRRVTAKGGPTESTFTCIHKEYAIIKA